MPGELRGDGGQLENQAQPALLHPRIPPALAMLPLGAADTDKERPFVAWSLDHTPRTCQVQASVTLASLPIGFAGTTV